MPKKWLPLESNPEVITEFASRIGLDTTKYAFHDVFGLDEEVRVPYSAAPSLTWSTSFYVQILDPCTNLNGCGVALYSSCTYPCWCSKRLTVLCAARGGRQAKPDITCTCELHVPFLYNQCMHLWLANQVIELCIC